MKKCVCCGNTEQLYEIPIPESPLCKSRIFCQLCLSLMCNDCYDQIEIIAEYLENDNVKEGKIIWQ